MFTLTTFRVGILLQLLEYIYNLNYKNFHYVVENFFKNYPKRRFLPKKKVVLYNLAVIGCFFSGL